MNRFYPQLSQSGFKVDSPVKKPRASEMARCAPPYTDRAREEPCRGGGICCRPIAADQDRAGAAARLP